jgi:hypothetical protein
MKKWNRKLPAGFFLWLSLMCSLGLPVAASGTVSVLIPYRAEQGLTLELTETGSGTFRHFQMTAERTGDGTFPLLLTEPGNYTYRLSGGGRTYLVEVFVYYRGSSLEAQLVLTGDSRGAKREKADFTFSPGIPGRSRTETPPSSPEKYAAKEPERLPEERAVKEPERLSEERTVKETETSPKEHGAKEPERFPEERTVKEPETSPEEHRAEEPENGPEPGPEIQGPSRLPEEGRRSSSISRGGRAESSGGPEQASTPVQTGDNNPVLIYIALLFTSGLAAFLILTGLFGRDRTHQEETI